MRNQRGQAQIKRKQARPVKTSDKKPAVCPHCVPRRRAAGEKLSNAKKRKAEYCRNTTIRFNGLRGQSAGKQYTRRAPTGAEKTISLQVLNKKREHEGKKYDEYLRSVVACALFLKLIQKGFTVEAEQAGQKMLRPTSSCSGKQGRAGPALLSQTWWVFFLCVGIVVKNERFCRFT